MNEQQKRAVENANRIAAANYGEYKQGCKEVGRKPITQREYIQRAVAEALALDAMAQDVQERRRTQPLGRSARRDGARDTYRRLKGRNRRVQARSVAA